MATEQEIIEEELVYGALRRERLWQRISLIGLIFGTLGCLSAAAVSVLDVDPPPVVIPYDPATGFALPEASVGATTVTENQAIIEAEVFRYVSDREVYKQLDNEQRSSNRVSLNYLSRPPDPRAGHHPARRLISNVD